MFALFYKPLFISFGKKSVCKDTRRKCTIFLYPSYFDVHPLRICSARLVPHSHSKLLPSVDFPYFALHWVLFLYHALLKKIVYFTTYSSAESELVR